MASNAKLSLELALGRSDLKLESVRFISQCAGPLEGMKTFGRLSEKTRESCIDVTSGGMTWIGVKPHVLVLPVPLGLKHNHLSSSVIPCPTPSVRPHPKLKYPSALQSDLPCF